MLVPPHIEWRYPSPNGLYSQLVYKMKHILKVAESRCTEKVWDNAKEVRCIIGKPEYTALRGKLNHSLKKPCMKR